MKTFDQLFAELAAKAAERPAGSGTVAALDAGVHAIGKKLVEEAAESWMAAEHEGPRAGGRGDQPAALPRPGADARLRTDHRRRLRPPVSAAMSHDRTATAPRCASPCPTRAPWPSRRARCCARRATASALTTASWCCADPDNGVEFFYLRPRDIAVYVGEGTLDLGITGRDLLLDSGAARRRGARTSGSAARGSGSPRPPAPSATPPTSPGCGSPRRTRASYGATSRSAGSRPA